MKECGDTLLIILCVLTFCTIQSCECETHLRVIRNELKEIKAIAGRDREAEKREGQGDGGKAKDIKGE